MDSNDNYYLLYLDECTYLLYLQPIMNWDWDKLQEKRQRQPHPKNDDGNDNKDNNNNNNNNNDRRPPVDFSRIPKDPLNAIRNISAPSGRGMWYIAGGLILIWLLSGIYIVNPDEEGIVLLFGKYDRTVGPGPHYHLPVPFENVYKPKVTQILRGEVGFRSVGQGNTFQQGQVRSVPEEASMLTGDENIVNVPFSVQYKIKDAVEYLFNVADPARVVKNAAEATMREIIGKSEIDSAITDGKIKIQIDAAILLQSILDRYEIGIQIIAVQLQDVAPPQGVIDAFKDVASAREDKSRIINEAEAYYNEIIPHARGRSAEIVNQAEAYRETRLKNAEGETNRFLAILSEYENAKELTKKRLYYETMEKILANVDEKVILPKNVSDNIIPFLPLGNAITGRSMAPVIQGAK